MDLDQYIGSMNAKDCIYQNPWKVFLLILVSEMLMMLPEKRWWCCQIPVGVLAVCGKGPHSHRGGGGGSSSSCHSSSSINISSSKWWWWWRWGFGEIYAKSAAAKFRQKIACEYFRWKWHFEISSHQIQYRQVFHINSLYKKWMATSKNHPNSCHKLLKLASNMRFRAYFGLFWAYFGLILGRF